MFHRSLAIVALLMFTLGGSVHVNASGFTLAKRLTSEWTLVNNPEFPQCLFLSRTGYTGFYTLSWTKFNNVYALALPPSPKVDCGYKRVAGSDEGFHVPVLSIDVIDDATLRIKMRNQTCVLIHEYFVTELAYKSGSRRISDRCDYNWR
ncbi:MAG: hypothetical protein K2Z25_22525 [Beijerinckiaceae bacterium]|nr:hypothetical protein [Beijerinckiaceae bacterium]